MPRFLDLIAFCSNEGHKNIPPYNMAPTDRQHSDDCVKSCSPRRRKSWRNWIRRRSTTKNSAIVEEQESKQHKTQQHEAETQEEQLTLLRRRTVSLAPVIETFHTPVSETFHTFVLDDYTQEEISASWFFDDDDDDDDDNITYNCENIRTVSFAAVIETFLHTLALDDYTQEEISASWFDDDDYDEIADDYENIISKMNNKSNGSIKRNKYCSRGLERMTDIGSALANCNKNDSYDAVLEEQDAQWDNQEDDSGERIARFYREVASRRCHVEAHQRGMQDALIAEELILVDERRKSRDEKEEEVRTVVCSLGMHQKRKSIQSTTELLATENTNTLSSSSTALILYYYNCYCPAGGMPSHRRCADGQPSTFRNASVRSDTFKY
jgi:hypothetical protein